jgi:hypothetical protein
MMRLVFNLSPLAYKEGNFYLLSLQSNGLGVYKYDNRSYATSRRTADHSRNLKTKLTNISPDKSLLSPSSS